jgi:Zn-dependent peptidase ImmA (M78 family)
MITATALKGLQKTVAETQLHASVPVSLEPLLEGIMVAYLPLSRRLLGFSLVRQSQAFIGINSRLGRLQRRRVMAHELGHILCKHPSAMHYMAQQNWLTQRVEAEAEAAAAFLLVPWPLPLEACGLDLQQLSSLLEVPPEILRLRARMAQRFGM